MHIKHVEIGNFRKLRAVRVDFAEQTTVFVGANNSGKTSATWLVGERFTIADAYLGVFLGWLARAPGKPFKDETLDAYFLRYQQRPAVKAAAEAEAI